MMWKTARTDSQSHESIFKGVLLASFLLLFHVALILGVAFLAFFSGGVIAYLPWILAFAGFLVIGSAFVFWWRMKKHGRNLKDILTDPSLQNRSIEVSLLGGLASLRMGHVQGPPAIPHEAPEVPRQLEAPPMDRAEQLTNLALLLKQDLITFDQFSEARERIMGH